MPSFIEQPGYLFVLATLLPLVAATFCGVELTEMLLRPPTAVPFFLMAAVTVPLDV